MHWLFSSAARTGWMWGWLAGIVSALGGEAPGPGTTGPFAERFANPPASARILKIIHGWPDAAPGQDALRARLSAQGFGGVVCNVSFQDYLESDSKWAAFTRAVTEAKRDGWALWLYDEKGYPSGNAGGLVLRDHPEWEARGLLATDILASGGPVTLDVPPGAPVLVRAYPDRNGQLELGAGVDLSARVRDRKVTWDAPAGRWRVVAITEDRLYEGTHADGNLHARMPYPNLLLPEPTARFVDLTYGGYAKRLGTDLGRYFEATFTDEPSLMSLFLKPMPYRPLPWATNLPGEFQRRRGYALERERLPALAWDAGPGTERLRHDFWKTVGELVSENFFGQIQTRCRALGVPSGGHLLAEEGLVGHVPLYGDFFRCIRRLDAPSIDCLTSVPSEVPWYIARLLGSAADLEGRTLVMSETSDHGQVYRPPGDARARRVVREEEIRGTCNRLIVAGVNVITSYYSFAELDDAALKRLNEWVGRACTAMRGGQPVADVAVVYPVESIWTRFVPSRHWTREASAAARVESLYRAAAEGLFEARRGFTFVDAATLEEARVEAGALVRGAARWRVVVLPGVDTLPVAAWERLAAWVRAGGVVIALGAVPTHGEREFPSARVRALGREMFGEDVERAKGPQSLARPEGGAGIFLPAGWEGLLSRVLDGVLEPGVKVVPEKSPIRVARRRIDGRDVALVINDGPEPWEGSVGFDAKGEVERWDLATGRRLDVAAAGGVHRWEPYGALVYRFETAGAAPRRFASAGPALPEFRYRAIPRVEPTVVGGEFVRAKLGPEADPGRSRAERPAWLATGELTRSGVDTFLFAQFRFERPLDARRAEGIAMETWVPEGQATPNQLLVILREEGGGDFLVETGRGLSGPNTERSYIPFTRFQLAGWSRDADGRLDLARIRELRIGWGGYLGTAGERVVFGVGVPELGEVVAVGAGQDR